MNVLVVDDSPLNLTIAKEYLEVIPDITHIHLCNDPTKVSSVLEKAEIDILILDIIMPEITGIELLSQLRAQPKYNDMPIIMLTSLDDKESYQKCFELGAFDYINKPIYDIEFYARLKVAMESKNISNHLKSLVEVTQNQNNELKEINAKLTEAKFNLVQSEKMAAIGQLAAGIAHEINNPLGFVNSNLEILHKYYNHVIEFITFVQNRLNDNAISNCPEYNQFKLEIEEKYQALKMNLILKECEGIFIDSESGIQRITEIVQSLRTFARSSKDDEKETHVLLDMINLVILITQNEVKYLATLELDIPDDIVLYCNRTQIEQVFINVILNAAQAIKSQNRKDMGLINIIARRHNQEIKIWFIDNGPGIPEDIILKIFEPFFTTKEIGKGTGLGLSISYDIIVNKHNGSFNVKSDYGNGATFTITLPIISNVD